MTKLRALDHSIFLVLLLVGSIVVVHHTRTNLVAAQTVPTRTPTPSAASPTATGVPGGPGPNPTPLPTSTGIPPQATATATPFPIPPTPEEGFIPTAQPCSLNPMARSLASGVNVRTGPGLDYSVVGNLLLDEVRPIIGRAAHVPWWHISLADGTVGWISDTLVSVSGYIGHLPIIDAPPLESDVTVTPGTPWAPTPRPDCTPPPTDTATATQTPSPTATYTLSPTSAGVAESVIEEATTLGATTTVEPATVTPTIATGGGTTGTLAVSTAAPLPGEEVEADNGLPWLSMIGVAFVLAAAGLFVVQRLRR